MNKLRVCVFTLVAITVAGGLMVTGCASSKGVSSKSKDDVGLAGDWRLTYVLRSGSELAIPKDVIITLSADIPKVGVHGYDVYGFSGVNNYSGPVTIEDSVYTGGPFGITMMAGEPELETFERLYLETLTDADFFRVASDGHGMEIAKSSGETALLFEKIKFDNSTWLLTAYFDEIGVRSIDQSKAVPELVFGIKSDISGFSGSNYIVGAFDVDYITREIAFKDIGTTKIAAPPGEAAIPEQKYIELLGKASYYVCSGDKLQIIDKDGTTLLVFTGK